MNKQTRKKAFEEMKYNMIGETNKSIAKHKIGADKKTSVKEGKTSRQTKEQCRNKRERRSEERLNCQSKTKRKKIEKHERRGRKMRADGLAKRKVTRIKTGKDKVKKEGKGEQRRKMRKK